MFILLDEVQHKGKYDEDESEDGGELCELRVPGLCLALGQEVVGTAGYGTGEACAFAALHQNDDRHGETGEKLEYGKNYLSC